MPAQLLWVRPKGQAFQIRCRHMASCITSNRFIEFFAVVIHDRWNVGRILLGLRRRFNELYCEAGFKMPFDVA